MEISFANRPLRTLCEDPSSSFAPDAADELRDRLADVRAADSAVDLMLVAELHADPPPQVVINLSDGGGIVCQVSHAALPTTVSGDVAWDRVRRIKIMNVGERP